MARWISKPKQIVKAPPRGGSLERRLAKLEQELAQIEVEKKLGECICDQFVTVSAGSVAKFRAEMNRPCPAHGFRELHIMHIVTVDTTRDPSSRAEIVEEAEVEEALNEYNRRLEESKRQREEDD